MVQRLSATTGDVLLLVGTRKGAFLLTSNRSRQSWNMSGPHSPGADVFHMTYDGRNGGRIFSAVNHMIWGPQIEFSDNLGQSWSPPEAQPKFRDAGDMTVKRLWHIEPGLDSEPATLYAGVEPAALFKSEDAGATWNEVSDLRSHSSNADWQPGLGGLCLHSIVPDPSDSESMWVGISAVGVFSTEDGGKTWHTRNQGVRADFLPDPLPDFGQCPHKVLAHKSKPQTLFQQNHCGVYRSYSGGQLWQDITEGLPSRFGFALGLHSQDPNTMYVIPEDEVSGTDVGGGLRYVTHAKFRVYRSRDAGDHWEPLTRGLPQQNAYLHVLREGMATDDLNPCGIYVGTTTGQVFYSRDDGDSWEVMMDHLPPINSVSCGTVV